MKGKNYLLQLTNQGVPVMPTTERIKDLEKLGHTAKYIIKLKECSDSIGMRMIEKEELLQIETSNLLIQPFIDFEYEVSFYYLNNQFQYALYAPQKK
ncbi:MAG TPA: hypothetical protein VM368_00655 [Flavisolibacter sp.]|nr:hypothetical protein [Flavisolibacter sp.]